MENKGLLFIPDISGFTRFINETEIDHSRLIIQELLEILINANELGLEISEIEGDAILFYKFGAPPQLNELYKQVERMFCAFHTSLAAYDHRRYCQCKACISAINLTLKVITHYGEFTRYNVHHFNKLIGKDVIVAHQLLKNNIDQHEYWLVTPPLAGHDKEKLLIEQLKWDSSAKHTEVGEIPFYYTQLGWLKNKISPELTEKPDLSKKTKVISLTREYDADIITMFHATGDFNYRSRWLEGVKAVEEVNHYLPRVGMRCRAVMENGQSIIYSTSYNYCEDRIEFSETNDSDNSIAYYTLEKVAAKRTKFTYDYYITKKIAAFAAFKLTKKKKIEAVFERSLRNLEDLVKEIKLPPVIE